MTLSSLRLNSRVILLSLLFVVVIVTALSVVYTKHMNRKYFVEWHKLQKERDEMNIEWGQLQLERSTFATSSEIEKKARKKLGMDQPIKKEMILIK